MADELKRVGMKFTAEGARDFKNELKECSAATKENYSELKLAQSQYDKNTTSIDKLKDRQKYLANQTDVYKDKVRILNEQLKEMETAENRDETAIAKKKAELNQAQAALNGYEKSLEEVNGQLDSHGAQLKEWGGKLQNIGGKVSEVGDTLSTHVTAPLVGVAGAATVAWKEVDSAMDIIVKKTGATGKPLEEMKNSAKSIAETIPTSFETAANAVGQVNTRFGVTGQKLEALSTQFVKFTDLNNEDVSTAVDETQKALSAFGLGADDAEKFLDVLNRTGQNTGVSMSTLRSGLVQNSATFQQMGLDINQSTVFMGQLEKSGANSETVMNGLRKALKNAAAQGKPMNIALAEIQDAILNGKDGMDGLKQSYDLFGKSGDQVFAAVKNGTLDFTALANTSDILSDSIGSVGTSYDETKGPMDQVQVAMNLLKDTGSELIETAAPMLAEAMRILKDLLVELKEKWESLSPETQLAIEKFLLMAAVLGPILSIGGRIIAGIGTIMSLIGTLLPLITAIGAPVLIVIGVITALIAVGVLLYKNWDKIKAAAAALGKSLSEKWNAIKTATANAWNAVKTKTSETWEAVKTTVGDKIQSAKNTAGRIVGNIRDTFKNAWDAVKENTVDRFKAIKESIEDKIEEARKKVHDVIEKIKGYFKFDLKFPHIKTPHFKWHWEDIGGVLSLPHFDGIEWYKKAYGRVAEYRTPTVVPTSLGWKGYGDGNGSEFVTGESHLRDVVREETAAALRNNSQGNSGNFVVNITVNASPGQNEEKLAGIVVDKVRTIYEREKAVWA